ncbi:porin [Frigidibacter oleivorans]|uniref:porin n=1 Tax=Frigidibacter oleivorans TaxID=2487129 RepID=UPI000F8C4ACC|nr:porin [Frigidibacter oleivorans]
MKKLLLASTALVGLAGAAAAEVVIEGSAEMGVTTIDYGAGDSLKFHNSYNINFVMTGETDTGLSFGATYRLDADANSEENQNPVGDNGTVWISGAFGKLTLGDTDGALDWAMTEPAMGTAITDEGTTHIGYDGNSDGFYDDQVLRYEYAFGDFGFAFSAEQDDTEDADGDVDDAVFGLGMKYATEFSGVELGFGFGYQTGEGGRTYTVLSDLIATAGGVSTVAGSADELVASDFDKYGLSVKAAMDNGFSLVLNYSMTEFDDVTADYGVAVVDFDGADVEHYGIGIGYEMGALLLHANYGQYNFDIGSVSGSTPAAPAGVDLDGDFEDSYDSYGLIVNYDLGGGAILAAGYASDVSVEDGDQDQYSIGLSLSF